MSPKMLFRTLVGLSLGTTFAIPATAIWPIESPEEWSAVLEWSGNGGVLEYLSRIFPTTESAWLVTTVLLVCGLAFAIAIQVGMFFFWRFARAGYVWMSALFILLTLFDGLWVMTPVDAAFHQLALILDGVIIAMAYLQPIASYFQSTKA